MKLKMVLFLLLLFSNLKIVGMDSGVNVSQVLNQVGWKDLPDEIIWIVFHFSVEKNTLKDAIKRLTGLRLLKKCYSNIDNNIYLLKMVITSHANDKDYQTILDKILFKGAYTGNNYLIEVLEAVPSARKIEKCLDILDEPIENELHSTELISQENHKYQSFLEANINSRDVFNNTPLMAAAEKGHKETVRKLSSYKACINSRGFAKDTAFLIIAKECLYVSDKDKEDNYFEILRLLISNGAEVDALDAAGLSSIDLACKKFKVRLINLLLDLRAHLNKQNKTWLEVNLIGMPQNEEINELLEKIKFLEQDNVKIDVILQLRNKPYYLSFKINGEQYKSEGCNDTINVEFMRKIGMLEDKLLTKIGEAIVEKVRSAAASAHSIENDSIEDNDGRFTFMAIFGGMLLECYALAEENNNIIIRNKIREIVKPIFKAFPKKDMHAYHHGLRDFEIIE